MSRRKLFTPCLVVLLLLVVIGGSMALRPGFASQTYEAAMIAGDADNDVKSRKLFKEACDEGSGPACQALNEQAALDRARKP